MHYEATWWHSLCILFHIVLTKMIFLLPLLFGGTKWEHKRVSVICACKAAGLDSKVGIFIPKSILTILEFFLCSYKCIRILNIIFIFKYFLKYQNKSNLTYYFNQLMLLSSSLSKRRSRYKQRALWPSSVKHIVGMHEEWHWHICSLY